MSNSSSSRPISVSVEQAVERLCAGLPVPPAETVPIAEALGRVLAEDLISPFPMPPFRRAAMDGYAVRAETIASASPDNPVLLPVGDESKAGGPEPGPAHAAGGALRIYTGAPVPDGYDTVLMQEVVTRIAGADKPDRIRVDRASEKGKHVAEAGEDIPQGATVLHKGTRLGAKEIGLLAAFGCAQVRVFRRPGVMILPVGDELVRPGEPLPKHHIYDANGLMLEARLRELGASASLADPLPDDADAIAAGLERALGQADIVVTTGGISVGTYDEVANALQRLGAEPLFTKVHMRPGTPTSAYKVRGIPVLCLSGNPSACFAGMELLLKPLVVRSTGRTAFQNEWAAGILRQSVSKPSPYPRYVRCRVEFAGDDWLVTPLGNDRAGNMAAFASANALALIPAGGKGAEQGERVRVLRLSDS